MYRQVSPKTRALYTTQHAIRTDRSAPGLCTQHNTPYVQTGQPQGSVYNRLYVQTGQLQDQGSVHNTTRHMYRQVSPKTRALYTTQHAICTDRSAPGLWIQQVICTDRSAPRPWRCTQHNTPYVQTGQPQGLYTTRHMYRQVSPKTMGLYTTHHMH